MRRTRAEDAVGEPDGAVEDLPGLVAGKRVAEMHDGERGLDVRDSLDRLLPCRSVYELTDSRGFICSAIIQAIVFSP